MQAQKRNFEGRFHNFDVLLIPLQNSSRQVAWKKSFQKKFVFHDQAQLPDTTGMTELVVARVPFQPFYIPSKNGQIVGIDMATWKIIEIHLKLKVKFTEAYNNGASIKMVRTLPLCEREIQKCLILGEARASPCFRSSADYEPQLVHWE